MGDTGWLAAAREHLTDPDLDVRFAASWTVARLAGEPQAVAELQTIALTESKYRQRAAALVVRRLDPAAARRWIEMLQQIPGCERVAIQAAGAQAIQRSSRSCWIKCLSRRWHGWQARHSR